MGVVKHLPVKRKKSTPEKDWSGTLVNVGMIASALLFIFGLSLLIVTIFF